MNIGDDDRPGVFADQAQAAADALERSLLKAVGTVEAELSRVVRTGEDDLNRLARMIAETLARLTIDGVTGNEVQQPGGGARGASLNQIAATVARAARRGARFT